MGAKYEYSQKHADACERISERSNSLEGLASENKPVSEPRWTNDDLPWWAAEAVEQIREELGDALANKTRVILAVHYRKSQVNHDETHVPVDGRVSDAVYRASLGGKHRKAKGSELSG